MSQLTCYSANDKCFSCRCAGNKVTWISCYPSRRDRCRNVNSTLSSIQYFLNPWQIFLPILFLFMERLITPSNSLVPEAMTKGDTRDLIREVAIKFKQCRSSLEKHISESSRHLFAKVLTNHIEKALSRNNIDYWVQLGILPILCLWSFHSLTKKLSNSLNTFMKKNRWTPSRLSVIPVYFCKVSTYKPHDFQQKSPLSDVCLCKTVWDKLTCGWRALSSFPTFLKCFQSFAWSIKGGHLIVDPFPKRWSLLPLSSLREFLNAIESFSLDSSSEITHLRLPHLNEVLRSLAKNTNFLSNWMP